MRSRLLHAENIFLYSHEQWSPHCGCLERDWPTPRPEDLLPLRTGRLSMGSPGSEAWKGAGKACVWGVYWVSDPKKQWYGGRHRILTEENRSWMLC